MKKNIFVALFAVVCCISNGFSYPRELSQGERDAEENCVSSGERDFRAWQQSTHR